jgi:hypothetical protein
MNLEYFPVTQHPNKFKENLARYSVNITGEEFGQNWFKVAQFRLLQIRLCFVLHVREDLHSDVVIVPTHKYKRRLHCCCYAWKIMRQGFGDFPVAQHIHESCKSSPMFVQCLRKTECC